LRIGIRNSAWLRQYTSGGATPVAASAR